MKHKLRIELIPRSAWGSNLRTRLTNKKDWDKIRNEVYKKANMTCQICDEQVQSLHAHEVWNWDEKNHIQQLVDIIGICKACHNTIHFGLAQKLGKEKEAIEHFLKVNTFDDDYFVFKEESLRAQGDFFRRSRITDWKLDVSFIERQGYSVTKD